MPIKVLCEVKRYETECGTNPDNNLPPLLVESHWNEPDKVVLTVRDEAAGDPKITIVGRHLITAIENAMRTSR